VTPSGVQVPCQEVQVAHCRTAGEEDNLMGEDHHNQGVQDIRQADQELLQDKEVSLTFFIF